MIDYLVSLLYNYQLYLLCINLIVNFRCTLLDFFFNFTALEVCLFLVWPFGVLQFSSKY